MEEKYFCEKCGLESSIQYKDTDDVMSVVYGIDNDHRNKSPNCDNPVSMLRIINEKLYSDII